MWRCNKWGFHLKLKWWMHPTAKNKSETWFCTSKQDGCAAATEAKATHMSFRRNDVLCFTQSNTWADKIKFCYQMKHWDSESFCLSMVIKYLCTACFCSKKWKKQQETAALFLPQKLLTADKDQWHCWWYKFWAASLYWSGCNAFGSQDGRGSQQRTSGKKKKKLNKD